MAAGKPPEPPRHPVVKLGLAGAILAGGMVAGALAGTAAAHVDAGSTASATAAVSPTSPVTPKVSQVLLQGFSTSVPPDAATAWTGIEWQKVAPGDPLGQVRSVVRWRGGFVALGAEVMADDVWRTPVWVSPDGATWQSLGADVFGPATIVLGVGEVPEGLVALSLASGVNQCGDEPVTVACLTLAAPLQSWTSADATTWTAHPGPAGIAPPVEGCTECGVDVPILRSGAPGLLAVDTSRPSTRGGSRMAFSRDGIDWESIPDATFPGRFDVHDLAGSASGFLAAGERGVTGGHVDTTRAMILSSRNGRTWAPQRLPTAGLGARRGTSAARIVAGPEGLLVTGTDDAVPGTELWWSKVAGTAWSRLTGYPPLGTWNGQGEGSGLMADGTLVGDGERMVAYRGGAAPVAWTSSDGRSWRTLEITGEGPSNAGDWPLQGLDLTPIGILATSDDGTHWFGIPHS
jgi:hypothetical protein